MSPHDPTPLIRALREVLTNFGEKVAASLEGVTPGVEFHRSEVYSIAGTLTFVDPANPEVELVVVTIHLKDRDVPQWEVDAMRRDSVVFAELERLTVDDATRMVKDPVAAATRIEGFLKRTESAITQELVGRV